MLVEELNSKWKLSDLKDEINVDRSFDKFPPLLEELRMIQHVVAPVFSLVSERESDSRSLNLTWNLNFRLTEMAHPQGTQEYTMKSLPQKGLKKLPI